MTARDRYPAIAALVDDLRQHGLMSGARVTVYEGGREVLRSPVYPEQDVAAIEALKGWDEVWKARRRCEARAKAGKVNGKR